MRRRQRFAFLAIGGLGLLAAVAPGLAATLALPATVPAAGQGAVEVKGFTVSDIDWSINDDGFITSVTFKVVRDVSLQAAVSSAVDEKSGNAVVRSRLEVGSGSPFVISKSSAWISCATTAGTTDGAAVCTFPGVAGTAPTLGITASELSRVNVIAFDRTS
jgi:hypothetical protein